jgi:TPM domain
VIVVSALVAAALVARAVLVGPRVLGHRSHAAHPANAGGGTAVPSAAPQPPSSQAPPAAGLKLSTQITDQSNVLTPAEHLVVERAVNRLFNVRGTRLWVVYVNNFGGLKPFRWAEDTMRATGFTDSDAILAVATDESLFAFRVPNAVTAGKAIDLEIIRRDRIGPAVVRHEWTRAAVTAANGLDVAPS